MDTLDDYVLDLLWTLETSDLSDSDDRYITQDTFPQLGDLTEAASDLFTKDDGTPDFDKMDVWQDTYGYIIIPERSNRAGSYIVSLGTKKGWVSFVLPSASRGT
jgi:hypothetical protein